MTDAPTADRIRGAVWGQFVGDAAALGAHWIYDRAELSRRWPGGPRGFETPAAGHYHAKRRPGDQTHYGDMALLQLASLVERGRVDPGDFGRRFVETVASPDYVGYRDKAMKGTLARWSVHAAAHPGEPYTFEGGAEDFEPATASRIAPVVAAHLDDPDLLDVVRTVTLVTQDHPRAVAYVSFHALALRELMRGAPLPAAFERAAVLLPPLPFADEVRDGVARARSSARGVEDATAELGQHCRLDQSLPSAVRAALAHPDDLPAALGATIRAGGDSAGRGAMIGAWLGAALGLGGVPRAWRDRLTERDRIAALVERLVSIAAERSAG